MHLLPLTCWILTPHPQGASCPPFTIKTIVLESPGSDFASSLHGAVQGLTLFFYVAWWHNRGGQPAAIVYVLDRVNSIGPDFPWHELGYADRSHRTPQNSSYRPVGVSSFGEARCEDAPGRKLVRAHV